VSTVLITDGDAPPFGLGVMWITVLNQLEQWDYAGHENPCYIQCSCGHNLCLDQSVGENVWDYWFEQPFPNHDGAFVPSNKGRRLPLYGHYPWPPAERERMREVVKRWVRVKPDVLAEVDTCCSAFDPDKTLAVHLRGTDKATEAFRYSEAERAPADVIRRAIRREMADGEYTAIFGMTDDVYYADLLHDVGAFLRAIPRSSESDRNLLLSIPGIQTGRNALIDALVAARCKTLIRTPSNMGNIPLSMGDAREIVITARDA
jgi:hypothetical protein